MQTAVSQHGHQHAMSALRDYDDIPAGRQGARDPFSAVDVAKIAPGREVVASVRFAALNAIPDGDIIRRARARAYRRIRLSKHEHCLKSPSTPAPAMRLLVEPGALDRKGCLPRPLESR